MKTTLIPMRLLLIMSLAFASMAQAQILNLDRENVPDSLRKKWAVLGSFNFSSDKQKNNLNDLNVSFEMDRYFSRSKYTVSLVAKNDMVYNGKSQIQNEGLFSLRLRDNDSRKLSPEPFVQYQWNGAWGMLSRFIYGANARVKLFDKKGTDAYFGIGAFNENERWNWAMVTSPEYANKTGDTTRQVMRANLYLKTSFKITKNIDFAGMTYMQLPINNYLTSYRWFVDANVYYKLNDKFSLFFHWDHVKDTYRLVPVSSYLYSYATGLQIAF
jgi:hypothetical protein